MTVRIDHWNPAGPGLRFRYAATLALVAHLALLWWWRTWYQPRSEAPTATIRLRLEPGLEQSYPSQREPIVTPVPAAVSPQPVEAWAVEKKGVEPAVTATRQPTANEILQQLDIHRLEPRSTVEWLPAPIPPQRQLGQAPAANFLHNLQQRPIPELPFADSPMNVEFYSFGVRGDMQRMGDALTREFGFKTRYGTRIQCAWMVVIVACGWK